MSTKNLLLKHLKVIIDHVEDDIIDYIYGIKNQNDFDEFIENILDKSKESHLTAYEQICKILFGNKKKHFSKLENNVVKEEISEKGNRKSKAKKKFSDIKTYQRKSNVGRKICDCEGQEHQFLNNCLNCGRIHCYEEGPGPCFFCSEMVESLDEKDGNQYTQQSSRRSVNGNKENKVFDDDNDYFKKNSSKQQIKKTQEKMVVALNFATRKVIEGNEEDSRIMEKIHKDIKKHLQNAEKLYQNIQKQSNQSSSNDELMYLLARVKQKKLTENENLGLEDDSPHFLDYGKLYDEEVLLNSDYGLCLSLHQPYASLLVAGVKKHEGRTWKTNHRGRLWIAAAAKEADDDEISALESFYRYYYNDKTLTLPRTYPTSCLLGCVTVEDCLNQEKYKERFPNGESDSPYVLICSNPIILPIFYPIVGKHKIYPLDKELHNCAKLSLRHIVCGVD